MDHEVIAVCWFAGFDKATMAGGTTRFYEIAKRSPMPLIIIDKFPSPYAAIKNSQIKILEYHVPKLSFLPPLLLAAYDRIVSLVLLCRKLISLPRKKYIIYVPASELPQLSLAGVFAKFWFSAKLVMANLNVNIYQFDLWINKFTHSFADQTITLTHDLKNALKKTGIRINEVNGVGFDVRPYKSTNPKKKPIAVYIGRHDPQKGIYDLLEIWSKVNRPIKLVTAGQIPTAFKESIQRKISELNLNDKIIFEGQISEKEKIKLLQSARVCLFPSYHEGWGIVPMESLACNTPVVVYDLPVYKESIGQDGSFYKVKIGDKNAFAKQVQKLLVHWPKKNKWQPMYTWETISRVEWRIICQA